MAKRQLPSPEVLRQLLRYEPGTGKLFWKARGPEWFGDSFHSREGQALIWNARMAGREAFTCLSSEGYRSGAVMEKSLLAHRVIWAMQHDEWPVQIDHINGIRDDNRLQNLRSVSLTVNAKNHKRRKDNASGITGVYRSVSKIGTAKWRVQVGQSHVGTFSCLGQAIRARESAKTKAGDYSATHGRRAA